MANWIKIDNVIYRRSKGGSWFDLRVNGDDGFVPSSDHRLAVLEKGYVILTLSPGSATPELVDVEIPIGNGSETGVIRDVLYWPEFADIVRRVMNSGLDLEDGFRPFGNETITIDSTAREQHK